MTENTTVKNVPISRVASRKKMYLQSTLIGRGEVIRTLDPLHPMQVRYQAALRPDRTSIIPIMLPEAARLSIEHCDNALQFTFHLPKVEACLRF